MDRDHHLIRRGETTTASVHDSQVDLSRQGETVYRDKEYFGVRPQASLDKTMHRAVRGIPYPSRRTEGTGRSVKSDPEWNDRSP